MINILFIHSGSDLYGSDVTVLQLIKGLNKELFSCFVVLPTQGTLKKELERYGAEVFIVDMPIIGRKLYNLKGIIILIIKIIISTGKLIRILKNNQINIIHSNTIAVLSGALISKICKVKHLWHIHEIIMRPRLIKYLLPLLVYKTSDIIICNSKQTSEWLEIVYPKSKFKSRVILNGVDNSRFNKNIEFESFRKELKLSHNDILVGLIGRINRWKGQKIFILAAQIVLNKIPNLKFIIVGDPPNNQKYFLFELKELLKTLNIENDKVKILSFRNDIEKIFASCDIVVVPSTEPEPFGLVAIEAMAMEKPVIASAHGGLLDIVEDRKTGIIIKPGDEEELARAIIELVEDDKLRKSMGKYGLERQIKYFSVNRYIAEFTEVYRKM